MVSYLLYNLEIISMKSIWSQDSNKTHEERRGKSKTKDIFYKMFEPEDMERNAAQMQGW